MSAPNPSGDMDDNGGDFGTTLGSRPLTEDARRRVQVFSPYFERLVALIRLRVRFPDKYDEWSRDVQMDFKDSRKDVADTLLETAEVLGSERLLQLLVEPLQQVAQEMAAGRPFDWRTAEASLYCVRGVNRCLPPSSPSPLLSQVLGSLPQLPKASDWLWLPINRPMPSPLGPFLCAQEPRLLYTVSLVVGAYSNWLAERAKADPSGQSGQLLATMMEMLWDIFPVKEAQSAAALTFQNLCDASRGALVPFLPTLLQLFGRAMPAGVLRVPAVSQLAPRDPSGERLPGLLLAQPPPPAVLTPGVGCLSAGQPLDLVEEDVVCIIEGVSKVVAAVRDQQQARQALASVLNPIMGPFQQLVQQGVSAASPGDLRAVVLGLSDRLGALFRFYVGGSQEAAVEAFGAAWPVLRQALSQLAGNQDAAEKVSSLTCPEGAPLSSRADVSLCPSDLPRDPVHDAVLWTALRTAGSAAAGCPGGAVQAACPLMLHLHHVG